MIAVTPYFAEYKVVFTGQGGTRKTEWQRCKVLGVTKIAGHDPEYVIEIFHGGTSSLTTVDEIKRIDRGNPL